MPEPSWRRDVVEPPPPPSPQRNRCRRVRLPAGPASRRPPVPGYRSRNPAPRPVPWFYGFIDTYTRVAMIAGIAVATLALIVHLGLSILALFGTNNPSPLIAATMILTALIGYAFTILGILLIAALMFLLLDMAKNLREMRRTIQERSQQGS